MAGGTACFWQRGGEGCHNLGAIQKEMDHPKCQGGGGAGGTCGSGGAGGLWGQRGGGGRGGGHMVEDLIGQQGWDGACQKQKFITNTRGCQHSLLGQLGLGQAAANRIHRF